MNPGGSAKDRIAVKMLDEAAKAGLIKPGGTVVEPTSGNTGVAMAMVAQQRGYNCVFVVPDKVGEDKRAVLEAYGAEVVVTPTAVPPDSPQSYYGVSDRLVKEIPGRLQAGPVLQPERPAEPLRNHRPGDLAGHGRQGDPLRGRRGHRRHHLRHRPLPARGLRGPARRRRAARSGSSAQTRRARSTPAAPAGRTLWRASGRTSGRRPTTRPCRTKSSPSATRRASR